MNTSLLVTALISSWKVALQHWLSLVLEWEKAWITLRLLWATFSINKTDCLKLKIPGLKTIHSSCATFSHFLQDSFLKENEKSKKKLNLQIANQTEPRGYRKKSGMQKGSFIRVDRTTAEAWAWSLPLRIFGFTFYRTALWKEGSHLAQVGATYNTTRYSIRCWC